MRRILRRLVVASLLIIVALMLLSGIESDPAWGDDAQELLGTWSIVRAEYAGTPLDQLRDAKLTFTEEGQKTLVLGPDRVESGTYRLVAGDPAGMDTTTEGKSVRPKGIYRLSGDQLEMVFAQEGGSRPTEFSSRGGDDHLWMVLQRESRPSSVAIPAELPQPQQRTFRMGITAFPHDISEEAAVATREFAHAHTDLIAHHIEGVPWAAMHRGEEFPAAFAEEMKGKKSMTPPGGQVYVAISPGRGKLKPHDKAPQIPAALRGKQYDHDLVKQAYLRYCRQMIDFFDPDYLSIGIEVNEIYGVIFKREWRAYLELHKFVYQELKRDHPELPIFASMTLHTLFNKQGGMVDAMGDLIPYCDVIGISYYPFFVADEHRLEALDWFVNNFDRYGKPYAMVETNAAAETTTFDSYTVAGTPARQLQYYQYLFRFAQQHDLLFVVAFIHRDYDALWNKIKGSSPQLFKAWMNCGFLDEAGNPRPSYELWKRYLAAAPSAPR